MNYYYSGQEEFQGVPFSKHTPSQYQDLIDDYLAGGGLIHRIEEGVTAADNFDYAESKYNNPKDDVNYKPRGGYALFDHIQEMKMLDKEYAMFGKGRDDH